MVLPVTPVESRDSTLKQDTTASFPVHHL